MKPAPNWAHLLYDCIETRALYKRNIIIIKNEDFEPVQCVSSGCLFKVDVCLLLRAAALSFKYV
jgi:hypothetical protein